MRHDDPRPELRKHGQAYAFSVLHAHQVAAVIGSEPGTAAMVSRSADGALLIPSLKVRGIHPVRGSTRKRGKGKGGRVALDALIEHVEAGGRAYLAVDGPRGPRNFVNQGIAVLARRTGAAVLNTLPLPSTRWILSRTWDRFQIPKPFACINVYFGEPLFPQEEEDIEQFRQRIADGLKQLEETHDPLEAQLSREAAARGC